MTQEEKAKHFDEVIEKIKGFLGTFKRRIPQNVFMDMEAALSDIFTKLAESEDEKIRKIIRGWIYTRPASFFDNGISKEEMLAWLEKQGQQPKKVPIWKHWKDGIAGNGNGEQIFLTKIGNIYSISSCLGCECDYIELSELDNLMLERQGEQKNKINSYKITFEDVLALECAIKTVKITKGGNELHEMLVSLYNKIHNAYLVEKSK